MKSSKIKPLETIFYASTVSRFLNADSLGYEKREIGYTSISIHAYDGIESLNGGNFDDWCNHVNSISIDFENEFDSSIGALIPRHFARLGHLEEILTGFMNAIKEHKEQQTESPHTHVISKESARRYLLLVPVLASHRPRVHIDASNGCFNVDLIARDNGVLSTQISDNGKIYYSYVSQNKKIFKITGTAKFRDSRDFIKFNKILSML